MGGFHCRGLIPPVQYFLAARASLSSAGVFLTAGPSAGVQRGAEFPTVATIVTSQGVQLFKFVGKLKVSGQPVDGPSGKLFSYSGVLKQTEPVIGPQHSLNVVGAKATEYIIEGGTGSGGGSGGGRNPPGSGLGGGTGPRGPGGPGSFELLPKYP